MPHYAEHFYLKLICYYHNSTNIVSTAFKYTTVYQIMRIFLNGFFKYLHLLQCI